MSFPVVRSQRFWPIYLNELVDHWSYLPRSYVSEIENPRELMDKLIREIRYPWHLGAPDDHHQYNCYHGEYKWCKTVREDYWDSGSEVLATKVADCDGSAICGCTCARAMGVDPQNVYVVFGYVQRAGSGEFLGGHAWLYIKHESFGEGWRYVELTLDQPPKEYPLVPDITKPLDWRGIELKPELLWNDEIYKPVATNLGFIIYQLHRYWGVKEKILGYLDLKKRLKETRRKYSALRDAWGIDMKPLKKAGWLSKLRWRR